MIKGEGCAAKRNCWVDGHQKLTRIVGIRCDSNAQGVRQLFRGNKGDVAGGEVATEGGVVEEPSKEFLAKGDTEVGETTTRCETATLAAKVTKELQL